MDGCQFRFDLPGFHPPILLRPCLFVREVIGIEPLKWQAELMSKVATGSRRLSVRSGHGTGTSDHANTPPISPYIRVRIAPSNNGYVKRFAVIAKTHTAAELNALTL